MKNFKRIILFAICSIIVLSITIIFIIPYLKFIIGNRDYFKTEKSFKFNYDEWQEEEIPGYVFSKLNDSRKKAQESGKIWDLTLKNNDIMVANIVNEDKFRFSVTNGYFIGTDHGEFAGEYAHKVLEFRTYFNNYFISPNWEEDDFMRNPIAMFNLNEKIYLLEGLSHLSSDGQIFKMKEENNKWVLGKTYKLNSAPFDVFLEGNKAYILTNLSIYEVYEMEDELIVNIIMDFDDNIDISFRSIIKKDNTFYLGALGGILICDLDSKNLSWFAKK